MLQDLLFRTESDWRPPNLDDLPGWRGAKRVGLDVETRDEQLKTLGPGVRRPDCYVVGVSFAIEDGPAHYLPMRHQGGDNLDPDAVLRYLRDQARDFGGAVVGANLPYDLDYLAQEGVEFWRNRWLDVMIAEPLLNELRHSYSLESIAGRHDLPGKDEETLRRAAEEFKIDPKRDLWKLPARYVGPYGSYDAELPLKIMRKQERRIDDQDLWGIFDLECRVQPALLAMRRRGVRIDLDRLDQVERWALEEERRALGEVERQSGVAVAVGDVWKPDAMARPLEAIGVKLQETRKGQKSVDKALLSSVEHPVAGLLMRARKVNKLRTTFAASIRNHLVGDRIHCTFNQMRAAKEDGDEAGARFGRLSSEHPNMQQQPARDEFAPMWRSIYIPDEGCEWFKADYSQQEPRMLVHFAELCKLAGASEAAQRFRDDPSTDVHKMFTQFVHGDDIVDHESFDSERKRCKNIYLGLCYGMGSAKLARELGLPTKTIEIRDRRTGQKREIEVAGDEAQAVLDKFDRHAGFIRSMARLCERRARERGYIVTILGRRCRFPSDSRGGYDWTHKALNRLIQGSSADQTKRAVAEAYEAGLPLQLQVHDELNSSVENREQGLEIVEIMRTCVELRVPSKVDVEFGPSWGQVEKVAA